jgi:hypothetical protein
MEEEISAIRAFIALSILGSLCCTSCERVGSRAVGVVSRSAERRAAAVLGRDLERDGASKALQLQAPRRVFKYTTEGDAQKILERGFAPGMHFTSRVNPGRPLTPAHAAERYGLEYAPAKRMAVTLPPGTIVKSNKVIGGAAGYGEVRIEQPLPPKATAGIIDLKAKH